MAAQGKRKTLVLSENEEQATTSATTSKKSKKCPKNKVWTSEQVELVLRYIKAEYKTKCDFNGIDFEADIASMYTEIRRCMAVHFPDDFGPEVLTEEE